MSDCNRSKTVVTGSARAIFYRDNPLQQKILARRTLLV
jgi:hypothetical protein